MRAALGLALVIGGLAFARSVLSGHIPFASAGAGVSGANGAPASDPASGGTITTAKAPSAGGAAPGFGGGFPQ